MSDKIPPRPWRVRRWLSRAWMITRGPGFLIDRRAEYAALGREIVEVVRWKVRSL